MSEQTQDDVRKWWAKSLLVGSLVGLAALPLGAFGTRAGVWDFTGGFMLLAVGIVLATIVFFLGIIAAVYANSRGLREERRSVLTGLAISIVIQGLTASSVPAIHNISTDVIEPPTFDKIVAIREAEEANPLAYETEVLAAPQKAAYPYVKPLVSGDSPTDMFAKAVAVIESMGMELVSADESNGLLEATDTTFWFGFKDDVVIRIRSEGSGSVVDVRSISRVGQSDLGKNAERIGEILALLGV